ncbi:XRE family transcriptional regulator [Bacillus salipaludis]|uniref:helix-turn-helix domain-containing protein n=1 Tax=Bacillus salipaludis TaxID=2547811 RepID=UPI003D240D93
MDKDILTAQIGQRLRYFRQQRKLTLDELADLTGVSKPMLGQIERGASNPTVSILWKIAAGLQIPFASFLARNPSVKMIRMADQPFFKEDNDLYEVYNTFASPGIPIESYRARLHPGCNHYTEPNGIGAIKSITVHSGTFSITIGDEDQYSLDQGDSVSFSTDVYQIFENRDKEICEISVVIYYSSPNIQL